MSVCSNCGKLHSLHDGYVIDGQFYCPDCFVRCENCSEILPKDKAIETHDGNFICSDCRDDYYYYCDDCGELFHNDDLHLAHDNRGHEIYVCENCLEYNYFQCDDCQEYYHINFDHISDDNRYICGNCWDDYTTCSNCGEILHIDDSYWSERDECSYCECCYNSFKNQKVKSYGYTPYLNFLKTDTDNSNSIKDLLYFGLEIEVSGCSDHADNFLNYFADDENEIFLTEDGSIPDDGFEITTQPMTYNYLISDDFKSRFTKAMEYLQNHDFYGHNYGGIHIHISKNSLNILEQAVLSTLIYCNDDSPDFETLLKITQRHSDKIIHWADPTTFLNKQQIFKQVILHSKVSGTRYTALNFTPNTLEFRVFNSSLRIDRIYKNIEFVKLCIDYTKYLLTNYQVYKSYDDIENVDTDDLSEVYNDEFFKLTDIFHLLEYAEKQPETYPNLVSFINEKQLTSLKVGV